MTYQERKNKRIAALTTVGVNALLLLLMIFSGGWGFSGDGLGRGSDNMGIEVNLGYDDEGTGQVEPATEVGKEDATDDEAAPSDPVTEQQDQTSSTPPPPQEVPETKTPETTTFTDPKSDVEIKEVKKEEKPAEKTTEKKPVEKPETPAEKKPVETKPVPKAVYTGKTSSTATTGTGEGKKGTPGNEGDDVGKEGNKGVEGGKEGAAVYKGTPGGGGDGGFGLQMTGWKWDEAPKAPKLQESNTRGKIVFEIEVDENGEIISINTITNEISPSAERLCRQELEKHTLQKTATGRAPERTKGRVTFNLDLQ